MAIRQLSIEIELPNISEEDLDRLANRHPSEARFVRTTHWGQREYQKAEELGRRVDDELRHAYNDFAAQSRDIYGQFALPLLENDGLPGESLVALRAEWSLDGRGWQPFVPFVATLRLEGHAPLVSYVTGVEWTALEGRLAAGFTATEGFTLLADAILRYEQEDYSIALLQLNTAVEWAEREFLAQRLGGIVPPESLKYVLRQGQDQRERQWVRPLCMQLGIVIPDRTWSDLARLRNLRGEAAHGRQAGPAFTLPQAEFLQLLRIASEVIALLTGQPAPKLPYPGTSLPTEDWMPIPWLTIGVSSADHRLT
jgi:hypothetical protein